MVVDSFNSTEKHRPSLHEDLVAKLQTLETVGTTWKQRDLYPLAPTVSLSSEIPLCLRFTRSMIFLPHWMPHPLSCF